MEKLNQQIKDYMNNNKTSMLSNPLYRMKITHIVAIIVLLLNAIIFTDSQISMFIQILLALVVFFHDFDDIYIKKQLAEKISQLEKDQKLVEAIGDINQDAIIAIDQNQIVKAFNISAEEMFGYTKEEMLGKDSLRKIIPAEYYIRHLKGSRRFFDTGQSAGFFDKSVDFEAKKKSGELIKIRVALGFKQDINSKIVVAYIKTIHDDKESQKRIYEQSRYAQMGEMIGNIAHQWRQPLTAISMIASSTKLNNQLGISTTSELDKSLNDITEYTNYLSQTIEVFRNYYSTDKIIKNFNLIEVINGVLSIIDASLKDNYIAIFKDFQSTNIECRGLPNELSQALINILNNARDVLLENKVPSKNIKIVAYTQDVNAIIEIFDNGGGIVSSVMDRIFEPYFSTKQHNQGTGMGLYMSKDIIEKSMKGSLLASNENFEIGGDKYFGACFKIKLPTIVRYTN